METRAFMYSLRAEWLKHKSTCLKTLLTSLLTAKPHSNLANWWHLGSTADLGHHIWMLALRLPIRRSPQCSFSLTWCWQPLLQPQWWAWRLHLCQILGLPSSAQLRRPIWPWECRWAQHWGLQIWPLRKEIKKQWNVHSSQIEGAD